jgi:hypothetical protein
MDDKDILGELDRWHAEASQKKMGFYLVEIVGIIGTGYTLTEAGLALLMEPSYKLAIQKQYFMRHDRQGNTFERTISVLVWNKDNKIEEEIMEMNGHRMRVSA